jgi:hypothetical protein
MNYRQIFICVLLMFLASCGSKDSVSTPHTSLAIIPINNSDLTGLSVSLNDTELKLTCSTLPADGYFFRLPELANIDVTTENWQGGAEVIHLAVGSSKGIDVGLVPLASYTGGPVSASIETGGAVRHTSVPPISSANSILQQVFVIHPLPNDQVLLQWTQVNTGDYNFDGEVNVSDITPIAIHWEQTVDTSVEDPTTTSVFWVDGDRNTEVNCADIVPIAQFYMSYVEGYKVTRNNELMHVGSAEEPAIVKDRQYRLGLPPLYSVVVPGSINDSWNVIPVDSDGQSGTSLDHVVRELASVKSEISISGIQLYKLDGSAEGGFDNGCSLLRIIEPGDIVDGASIGTTIEDSLGECFHYAVPANQLLYLEVMYYPAIDPATGQNRLPPGGLGQPIRKEDLAATLIPFYRQPGSQLLRVTAGINFVPNPAGGYFIDIDANYSPAQAAILADYKARINCLDGTVSWDVGGRGSYENCPHLADPDLHGISLARASQLTDYLRYRDPAPALASLTGQVLSYSQLTGQLVMQAPVLATAFNSYTLPDTQVRFSENALFESFIKLPQGSLQTEMDPYSLKFGDQVVLEVDLLGTNTPDQWNAIWLRHLIRVVPLDAKPSQPPAP